MSDFYKSIGKVLPKLPWEMTPAERETAMYRGQAEKDVKKKRSLLQPLNMVFDLLQRGQYVSANVVDEILTSLDDNDPARKDLLDVLKAAGEGITGKRKGSYKDILVKHGGMDEDKSIFGPDAKFLKKLSWADILGFVGDVMLDPLTYVNPLQALKPVTKAAKVTKAIAPKYADDIVKLTTRMWKIGDDDLAKLAQKGFDLDTFRKLGGGGSEDAAKYLASHGGRDIGWKLNKLWKEAYDDALLKQPEELMERIGKLVDDLPKGATWQTRDYADAGKRASRFFGKEFNEGPRTAAEVGFNKFKRAFGNTKVGEKLEDAVFAVQTWEPIAALRKMFGIRNPYQKRLSRQFLL